MLLVGMRRMVASLALILLACGCSPYALPPAPRHVLPPRIAELRLYSDLESGAVFPDARPYTPSYELWSDGASKRRWIRLPSGARIDTSDMDAWRFPVGTELFKEFSVGGKRIETRLLRKVSPDADGWAAMSYVWNGAQNDAVAAPDGVDDALGTPHDVPSARVCMACHGGRPERVLGFGAIQLAHDATRGDELTLDRLVADGRLTRPPRAAIRVPGTAPDAAALGYLHANCGHCHNAGRPADASYFRPPADIDFGLRVADLAAVDATTAFATAQRFPMDLDSVSSHRVLRRMTRDGLFLRRMPPLATEVVDRAGVALVAAWLRRVSAVE